ncbi:uncharacterized protein NPIL_537381 [Nephila pilipes]|uniref:C2H2-type domain-containing protein n=1 Tax=Nephila pilipes TaxID=299642 RepID=A0A8X6TPC8_NEPPI|nr:uncharacterized protein NPIL_537381 [Nephila pilipes]
MDNFCFVCDKSFSTAPNLRRRARLTHNVENKVSTCRQIKCNVRSAELVSMKALMDHVASAHNIAIEKETKKFDTYEAFKIWKEDVEKQTTAFDIKNTGSKSNNMKSKTTYFYCHRNGFCNAKGDKKRTIKISGSNKVNGNHPSKMKVCEDNESQVTRKDLLNLKVEHFITDGITDTNDVVSAGKLVESSQGREDSPVILFKNQNVYYEDLYPGFKAEDFPLVIMNSSQRDILNFYRNDTLSLDFTHGMNAYGFDLATVLVLDDKREGFPVAFILTNRQDSKALSIAFVAMMEYVSISPKVLIMGDAESFSIAWRTAFGVF